MLGSPRAHPNPQHTHTHTMQDPKDRDRVDRECRVMRALSNHACVVRLYEVAETPDCVYLFMEHCEKG